MAIYRIHPEKDTTIWSQPNIAGIYGNAGRDEILELGGYPDADQVGRSKRILLEFSNSEINNIIDNKTSGAVSCSINLYNATNSNLPSTFTVEAYPLSQSWTNGIGKLDDNPTNTTGASWKYRDSQTNEWSTLGGSFLNTPLSTTTVSLGDKHDLKLDVTDIVLEHISGSITNNGIILKLEDSFENYTDTNIELKYFSTNTNTIYSPYLEFKWNDVIYSPGVLTELNTENANVNVSNLKSKYSNTGTYRFRLSAKPTNPIREFSTSSIYLKNYVLPQNSYWSIVDEFSNDTIVDFDETYTKISADANGSYFDFHMGMLSPERYYRLLVKTTINNSTFVFDNSNLFKVVRNG